jgi:hypothetical protein
VLLLAAGDGGACPLSRLRRRDPSQAALPFSLLLARASVGTDQFGKVTIADDDYGLGRQMQRR